MWMVIRRRTALTLCALAGLAGLAALALGGRARPVFAPASLPPVTAVLDPGHGGEDGGAVSPSGLAESGVNLAVALRTYDLLRLMGRQAVLTRTEEISLGDPSLGTIRQRKASDIRRRVELVNGTENAVLVSIHQNSLPASPVTHGAQVFWNQKGQSLAEAIQSALNAGINAGNEKRAVKISSSIYLMRHAEVPAALVECGFLSNAAETARLQEGGYQKRLAAAIAAGYLRFTAA